MNVINASLSGTKVTLQTSPHSNGSYVVTVINVKDLAGNTIAQSNTAEYEYTYLPPDSLVQFQVQNVEGVTQEPNHTPLKTIDGLGALNGDPDSRWAADPMPENLIFDLGSIKTVSQTKLSFYNWDSGRIYNYSISVSSDHNNWITVVPQSASASNAEWTIDQFSAVNARYVRVNFFNNNQSTWAGLWEAEILGGDQSTPIDNENELPKEFLLYQNYPNPFNPSTTIKYQISDNGLVKIDVYNLLGEVVATLVNEQKPAGSYQVQFDASRLASGTYFYKLQEGSFVEIKKMILLK
jgi:hypothetical protein